MTLDPEVIYPDTVPSSHSLFCPICQKPSPTYTKPYPTYSNTLKIHCFNCRTFIGTAWKESPDGQEITGHSPSTCCDGM